MATIMVIDDEAPVRGVLRELLEQDGHKVLEACDGSEAIALIRQISVDLIITDLVMPNKSGIDVIMEIKNAMPALPIIALSGGGGIKTGRFDYLQIAKLIGANQIMSKPFAGADIRKQVNDMLA